MSIEQKSITLWLRFIAIILGIFFLFWLPIEDTTTIFATLFAIAFCFWFAVSLLILKGNKVSTHLYPYIIIGLIAGVLVTPLTLFFMAFKTGLHGHQSPDFTNQQLQSVIQETPIWIIGGFLIGLGSGIWRNNQQTS